MKYIFRVAVFFGCFSVLFANAEIKKEVIVSQKISLNNTEWRVLSIKDQVIPSKIKMTIHFGKIIKDKAPVYGSSGCNNFKGQYYITEQQDQMVLGFSQFATTRKACLNGNTAKMEGLFLQTIPFVQTFFIHNGKLNLQSIDKKVIIVLGPM